MSHIENSDCAVSLDVVFRIARVLDVPVCKLLSSDKYSKTPIGTKPMGIFVVNMQLWGSCGPGMPGPYGAAT